MTDPPSMQTRRFKEEKGVLGVRSARQMPRGAVSRASRGSRASKGQQG